MSRLGRALLLHKTDRKFYPMTRFDYTEKYDRLSPIDMNLGYVYTLEATFKVKVRFTELEVHNGHHADRIEMARRQVLREVFGEFVPVLCEAEFAATNHEGPRAAELIRKVIAAFDSTEELKEPKT
jgi:hypothetical protein